MDLTNTGTGGSAVACPVCTLYLREGISLQRHLDTHPKEQVIEALIKASTTSVQTQPMQLSPSGSIASPSIQSPQNAAHVAQATHLSNQSPYPIGPIYECPPISAVIPPQFTSFSYQQFVNNGTMMVPQYAMAPQTNQMMHMLYNPYGMYQQQQMPAVQMISPVSSIPNTSRIRPIGAMHSETSGRTAIAVSVNSSEPKQILPEILPEPEVEAEQVLPDINLPVTPLSSNEDTSIRRDESETTSIRLEHDRQSSHNSNVENQRTVEHDYDNIPRPFGITCNVNVAESDDKVESVLPDIEDVESTQVITTNVQCKSIQYELTEAEVYTGEYDNGNSDLSCNEIPNMINRNEQKRANAMGVHCSGEVNKNVTVSSQRTSADIVKDSAQPEVEQLEHLLITIMESELNSASQKEINFVENHERSDKQMFASSRVENMNDTDTVTTSVHVENYKSSSIEIEISEKLITHSDSDHESNFKYSYRYKHSLSAPASPVMQKRTHQSSSVHSKFCSIENLHNYQADHQRSIIQDQSESVDEKNEEEDVQETCEENVGDKNEIEDNFNEADMELEQLHSPHTPFIKHGESTDHMRSHTPLSTCSGISVLRVRKDLSKPCSPASMRSFCHMDANDLSHDEESNNAADFSTENDPINCPPSDQDIKTNGHEISILDNIENKVIMSPTYHQSVITEHGSSFPTIHSQQAVSIYEAYPLQNSKTRGILNLSESISATDNTGSKIFHSSKSVVQKPSMELLSLNEDAHAGPMNVFEFDGLQILVPSTFISDSSQKAVSATSQLSTASSEGGVGVDEEVKSVNMRADETMPARGELSEQESNGCTEQSAWQLYVGQESSRMSTSYDLMARESWEESEGSDNEIGGPLLDSRSLATHFTSSLFLDRDRKTPTNRMFKCYHCSEIFDCPKERRVHSTTVHREVEPSSSKDPVEQPEVKDIKLLDGRMNVFEDIFVPSLHVQQVYHHQQPLLHQLQPPQSSQLNKIDPDHKIEKLVISSSIEITCALCNQRFNSERSLQLHHRRMHDAEVSRRIRESTKCQICNEQFPSVLSFNAHLKIHPLECAQCGKYFYRKQNFKLHMKRHLGIKPFPCTVCDKAFLTKQKLDEHTNGHTGNAPVKCNLCNETFRRYSNLTQHKNRHHLNIKKKLKDYICHCGEVFHTKKKLAWHKETHDDKPKACTYCNERFIHMASLTRHMRRAHNRRFVPDAQRDNENVECPICKCIYLRSSLAVHMRVHNGEKPYECQVCSKAFSTKWNLQLHRWTHAARSTKPFKCNQCSAAFYRHSDYIAHMNSHRNVRPYTCNYCGAQFIRKYNCLRHVKEHEENKAYTCDVCNKAFHRSYYLKEHLRVHSGARPYTCHICGKSSGTKSNHNKHVRIHHAREPVNTEN